MSDAARPSYEKLREELVRCGALAISERADGCVPKSRALRIREIAYRTCWPEDNACRCVWDANPRCPVHGGSDG